MGKLEKLKNRVVKPLLGFVLAISACATPLFASPASAIPQSVVQQVIQNNTPSDPTPVATPPTNPSTENNTPNQNTTPSAGNTTPDQNPTPSEDKPSSDTEDTSDSNNDSDTGDHTCYSEIGALGWLICPVTGLLSKGIDFLYGIVEELSVANPVDLSTESPIHTVWAYIRNITNIIFIIFLLVIVYSQITGLGISNYGIKRALPRLIIAAILVNVSDIVCALSVDLSNAIGANLSGMFTSVANSTFSNGSFDAIKNLGIYELFIAIASGGAIAGLAIAFSGGILELLLLLIPIILGGIIAVLIGLFMLSLRQSLVMVLLIISPVAFICYLLPNTEKWYRKWLNLFVQMLTFYPLFSLLFGTSRLAGWLFIATATSPLGLILGIAIQILPLFLTISLMKFSGTILGGISAMLGGLGNRATGGVRGHIDPLREARRAEKIAKYSQRGFNPFRSGSWLAHRTARQYRLSDRQKLASATTEVLNKEKLDALKSGKRIIGYDRKTGEAIYARQKLLKDENGKRIYTTQPITRGGQIADRGIRKAMEREGIYRSHRLRADAQATEVEAVHGELHDYLTHYGVKSGKALGHSSRTGEYAYRGVLMKTEKLNNDYADDAYIVNRIKFATELDAKTGQVVNREEYDKIMAHSGAGVFNADNLKEKLRLDPNAKLSLSDKKTLDFATTAKNNYLGLLYQPVDAHRLSTIKNLEVYANNQVTMELTRLYEESAQRRFNEGLIACNNVLAFRGDYDKILDKMTSYYNAGNVKLATSESNMLAMNLMAMKGAAPNLGRFGKFLNMETWAYTDGKRGDVQIVTMDEFSTGFVRIPEQNADGTIVTYTELVKDPYTGDSVQVEKVKYSDQFLMDRKDPTKYYRTKIDLAASLKGTSLKDMDRTAIAALEEQIDSITPDKVPGGDLEERKKAVMDIRKNIDNNMAANVISALPSLPSGSEQMNSLVMYITGLKPGTRGGFEDQLDKIDRSTPEGQLLYEIKKQDFDYRTRNLMARMTPRDLIQAFRSDVFAGVVERFTRNYRDEHPDSITLKEDFLDYQVDENGVDIRENGKFITQEYKAGTYTYRPEDSSLDPKTLKENKAYNKKLAAIAAYEEIRSIAEYPLQKLAENNLNLDGMKNPIRRALKVDEQRKAYRDQLYKRVKKGDTAAAEELDNLTNSPEASAGESSSWIDNMYAEACLLRPYSSIDAWADEIRRNHPEIPVSGTGVTWLENAWRYESGHTSYLSPEAWLRDLDSGNHPLS